LEQGQLLSQEEVSATNAARGRAARATNTTKSKATNDKVRRQCATAKKLTELDMDRPGSHVTKRYRPATTGSDGIFADYRCGLLKARDSNDLNRTILSVGTIALLILSCAWIVRPFVTAFL
jgi:hypothetical protein